MKYRQLGAGGPEVPVLGLGASPLGGALGGIDEKEAIATMRFAIDNDVSLIDTAQSYKNSEERVGKALKDGYRERCFLATKVSWRYSRADIEAAIEDSLRKLGVDYVDLYQLHGWWDPQYPIQATMETMARVREQGKARFTGVCNFDAAQMQRALSIAPFQSNQPVYNMFDRRIEEDRIPFCEEHGIGLITHSTLAQGLLSGRYKPGQPFAEDDNRSRDPRFHGDTFGRYLGVAKRLKKVAEDKGLTLTQLAIAWALDAARQQMRGQE